MESSRPRFLPPFPRLAMPLMLPLRALRPVQPLRHRLLLRNPTRPIPLRHKNFLSFVSFVPSWDLVFDLLLSSPAATLLQATVSFLAPRRFALLLECP